MGRWLKSKDHFDAHLVAQQLAAGVTAPLFPMLQALTAG
jgi:hypothetical protein